MQFHFAICGYGFGFQAGTYDINMDSRIILSWAIVRKHVVWRGESHVRYHDAYNYRCTKNGKVVENISFRSPIVNHI